MRAAAAAFNTELSEGADAKEEGDFRSSTDKDCVGESDEVATMAALMHRSKTPLHAAMERLVVRSPCRHVASSPDFPIFIAWAAILGGNRRYQIVTVIISAKVSVSIREVSGAAQDNAPETLHGRQVDADG
eukprot:579368-Hanusia_phi.AAC.1